MDGSRHTWTDARLDDFRRDVDKRFDETNQRMDAGFARVDADLQAVNLRFDALNRILLQVGAAIGAALITLTASMIGLIATQL